MKKFVLAIASALLMSAPTMINASHTFLKAAIEENNVKAVKEELKRIGRLDYEAKKEALELARIQIMKNKNFSMSAWDWTKFLWGSSMAFLPALGAVGFGAAGRFLSNTKADKAWAYRITIYSALLTTPGVLAMISGYRCNADRARYNNAEAIKKAIERHV